MTVKFDDNRIQDVAASVETSVDDNITFSELKEVALPDTEKAFSQMSDQEMQDFVRESRDHYRSQLPQSDEGLSFMDMLDADEVLVSSTDLTGAYDLFAPDREVPKPQEYDGPVGVPEAGGEWFQNVPQGVDEHPRVKQAPDTTIDSQLQRDELQVPVSDLHKMVGKSDKYSLGRLYMVAPPFRELTDKDTGDTLKVSYPGNGQVKVTGDPQLLEQLTEALEKEKESKPLW